ncbi:hypothetical protein ACIQYL_20950 [Lysinibacillus xylanilyticus]|uniref:hypothetical protein n=1 Tax=Lysinibacillus xylanilyticus TaxID=582475 RepID=UPI0038153076
MYLPSEINTLKCIKQTQDLIVSILIGNSWIVKTGNLYELHFKLKNNKHFFLRKYLDSNPNTSVLIREVNEIENIYAVEHSIVLERILRDWTNGRDVIAINPINLSSTVFMLWICLFGERITNEAILENTTISLDAAKTLCEYYPEYMESAYIIFKNNTFRIGALDEVFLYSIKNNRPSYETLELSTLLPHFGKLNELKRVAEGEMLNA